MGKPIKITQEHIDEARQEFETTLNNIKLADGKISYTKTFGSNAEKATVYFTSEAWTKMVALLQEFTDEVAWHGLACRSEDPAGYVIYDILVYPQEVTGATVNTDQEKYQVWLMEHEDDVFNNIRMQGHSHVNMTTSPSSVDLTHQEKILDQLEDDMFYIFMVWNKKFESHTKVYDLQKNTLYENSDVDVKLLDTGIGLDVFITEAKCMVSKRTYAYSGNYNNRHNGYCGYNTGSAIAQTSNPYDPAQAGKSKKEKQKTKVSGGQHGYQRSLYEDWDDDELYKLCGI